MSVEDAVMTDRQRLAERACRAWGGWLHALVDRPNKERNDAFLEAQEALRDWWAVVEESGAE